MMKRTITMLLVLTLALALAACGNKEAEEKTEDASASEMVTEEAASTDKTEAEEVKEETSSKGSYEGFRKNDTRVYKDAEEVVDVTMGVVENGSKLPLITIVVPTNYGMSTMYMDENGKEKMPSGIPNFLDEAFELDAWGDYMPSRIGLTSTAQDNHHVFISTFGTDVTSLDDMKERFPDGFTINEGSAHEAYFCDMPGDEKAKDTLVYKLSDNWTLLVQSDTVAKTGLSREEVANEFYSLITPLH